MRQMIELAQKQLSDEHPRSYTVTRLAMKLYKQAMLRSTWAGLEPPKDDATPTE